MGAYTLPRRYHPDFRNPREKPKGLVELNTNHPRAKDVVAYYPIIAHSENLLDISGNGRHAIKTGLPFHTIDSVLKSRAVDFGTFSDQFYYTATIPDLSTFTVIATIRAQGVLNNKAIVSLVSGDNQRVTMAIDGSPDDVGVWDNVNSWLRSFQAYEQDIEAQVAIVYNGTTDRKIYYNGILRATDSSVSTIVTGKNTLYIGMEDQSEGERFDGLMGGIKIFSDALSDAEILSHQVDEYQLLRPVNPASYSVPVVAPSGNTITANQTEAGDATVADIDVVVEISADQTEAGDATVADVDVLVQISANQTEAGDSQSAALIVNPVVITANQTEAGDATVADVDVLVQISADQAEAGDATAADVDVLVQISASQTEAGDTQAASIVGVLTATITADQAEAGDSQAADIDVILNIAANQSEVGDTTAADVDVIVQISANQLEAGDTQVAALTGVLTSSIAANQAEAGDTTVASIDNIVSINANQAEAGDATVADIDVIVNISANQLEAGDTQVAALFTGVVAGPLSATITVGNALSVTGITVEPSISSSISVA